MKTILMTAFIIWNLISCSQESKKTVTHPTPPSSIKQEITLENIDDRKKIIDNLKEKIERNKPLYAHVFVPLCDNEHQGIVPTTESLGNGLDLKRNLYWATSKGMKRYFNELPDWELILSINDPSVTILERVVFRKTFNNSTTVYLVADAYRGDKMVDCLNDYFNSLSGSIKDSLIIDNEWIGLNGSAQLIAFNGHNGLMDETTTHQPSVDGIARDAVAIACASAPYFKEEFKQTNSYPLVTTTNLLYPGAFILEGILNEWAQLKSEEACKIEAGNAYYKHKPKSGPNGSQKLFTHGW